MEKKNLKLVRLITNIDLIVNLVEDKENSIVADQCLVLVIDSNLEAMTQMLYMYPWLSLGVAANPLAAVEVSKSQISYVTDVDEDMYEYFRNMWKAFIEEEKDRKDKGKTKVASGEKVVPITKNNPTLH